MTGGQLANVRVPLKRASPRLAIVLRLLHLQLLNAHMALRIVEFHDEGLIDQATKYSRLKERLNERRSFKKFLTLLVTQWQIEDAESPTPSTPRCVHQVIGDDPDTMPRYNRIEWFNQNEGAKAMRLSPESHEQMSSPARRCYICSMKTTVNCSRCRVHLCKHTFGNLRKSCWQRHHSLQTVSCIGNIPDMFPNPTCDKVTALTRPPPTSKRGRRGKTPLGREEREGEGEQDERERDEDPARPMRRSRRIHERS